MATTALKKVDSQREAEVSTRAAKAGSRMSVYQKVRSALSGKLDLTPAYQLKPGQKAIRVDWEAAMRKGTSTEEIDRETQKAIEVMVVTARKMRMKR